MLNIFEKKNNTVAFTLITVAALFWGGFGLIAAKAQVSQIPPLLFTLLSTFFATLIVYLYCLLNKIQIRKAFAYCFSKKEFKLLFFYRILVSLNIFVTVAGYHFLSNKIVGLAITEINPLIAVILSYYFFSDDYLKKTTNIYYNLILIFCAVSGVLILLSHETNMLTFAQDFNFNQQNIYGILLTLIGSILIGYTTILGPKITTILQKDDDRYSIFEISNIARLLISGVTFLLLLFISIFYFKPNDFLILMDYNTIFLSVIFGVFVIYLPAILGMIGGAIATNHNVYLAWFIAPIFGSLALWVFGFGEINATIALSFILILVPNLLLNLDIEDSFSFKATFIWILLFAIVLFYYQGKSINSETYFNSANALLVFFALMVGYLISKLNERSNFRERLFMQFLHKIRADGVDEWAVESISAKFQQANNRLTDKVKDELSKFNINTGKYSELLDFKFIQNRRLYNVGELFVLLLISLLLIGITTVYRDNSFLYDSYAFIVNTAVVFTLAQVVERMFFSEYEQQTPKNILMKNTVSMLFLIVLIIAIVILFSSKHNFNI